MRGKSFLQENSEQSEMETLMLQFIIKYKNAIKAIHCIRFKAYYL